MELWDGNYALPEQMGPSGDVLVLVFFPGDAEVAAV
jgi:hypothetical protein